jgi:hypothetical protein
MHDIPFCNPPPEKNGQSPTSPPVPPRSIGFLNYENLDLRNVNWCSLQIGARKARHAAKWDIEDTNPGHDSFVHAIRVRWEEYLRCIRDDLISSVDISFPAPPTPLDYCILDILGDYFDNPAVETTLGATQDTSYGILLILLRCAALHQATLPPDSVSSFSIFPEGH